MKIIKSPWDDTFFKLLSSCEDHLRVTSPYVKSSFVEQTLTRKNLLTKIELVTRFRVVDFYRKSSDLEAVRKLVETDNLAYKNQAVHAKTYIFDEKKAVITSGNWTFGGLVKNYEYGVLVEDTGLVGEILNDFELLKSSSDTSQIQPVHISEIEPLIRNLAVTNEKVSSENSPATQIAGQLSGWRRDVFDILQLLDGEEISLTDILSFVPALQRKHPTNKHIEAKIRQQLQQLRDMGLVDFLGKGTYRKLW